MLIRRLSSKVIEALIADRATSGLSADFTDTLSAAYNGKRIKNFVFDDADSAPLEAWVLVHAEGSAKMAELAFEIHSGGVHAKVKAEKAPKTEKKIQKADPKVAKLAKKAKKNQASTTAELSESEEVTVESLLPKAAAAYVQRKADLSLLERDPNLDPDVKACAQYL